MGVDQDVAELMLWRIEADAKIAELQELLQATLKIDEENISKKKDKEGLTACEEEQYEKIKEHLKKEEPESIKKEKI